jgi:hypothetical protein
MSRVCACLCALTPLVGVALADASPAGRAGALARLVDGETAAVVRVDFGRADLAAALGAVAGKVPEDGRGELELLAERIKEFQAAFTRAGGEEFIIVLSGPELPFPSYVAARPARGGGSDALGKLLIGLAGAGPGRRVETVGDYLIAGGPAAMERLTRGKPAARPELAAALEAAGDVPALGLLIPTDDQRRVFAEMGPSLHGYPGAAGTLARGVRWAAVGVDTKPGLRAKLTVQAADADTAGALAGLARRGLTALGGVTFRGERRTLKELLPKEFEQAAAALAPEVKGDRLVVTLDDPQAVTAVAALAGRAAPAPTGQAPAEVASEMKKIVIAMHRYEDANKSFPPHAIYSADGMPLLSWRVALLPNLGEMALHREFKLDEPWDSDHNKKLIARMPAVYRSPRLRDRRPGVTTFLAPVGEHLFMTGTAKATTIADIIDGTVNTIALVDASDERAVEWTRPADLVVDRADPWKGLLGHYPRFFVAGMADASVRAVPKTVSAATLWAAFTGDGGEVLGKDW